MHLFLSVLCGYMWYVWIDRATFDLIWFDFFIGRMTVLGRDLVFQLVLVTQTCTFNSENITLTLQIFHPPPPQKKKTQQKNKKTKHLFQKEHNNPPPLPPKPHNNNNNKRSHNTSECFWHVIKSGQATSKKKWQRSQSNDKYNRAYLTIDSYWHCGQHTGTVGRVVCLCCVATCGMCGLTGQHCGCVATWYGMCGLTGQHCGCVATWYGMCGLTGQHCGCVATWYGMCGLTGQRYGCVATWYGMCGLTGQHCGCVATWYGMCGLTGQRYGCVATWYGMCGLTGQRCGCVATWDVWIDRATLWSAHRKSGTCCHADGNRERMCRTSPSSSLMSCIWLVEKSGWVSLTHRLVEKSGWVSLTQSSVFISATRCYFHCHPPFSSLTPPPFPSHPKKRFEFLLKVALPRHCIFDSYEQCMELNNGRCVLIPSLWHFFFFLFVNLYIVLFSSNLSKIVALRVDTSPKKSAK